MKQKEMNIHEFSKGDIITRIKPSKPYPTYYGENEVDRAFIGKPYEFVGIANGCLYIKIHVDESKNKDENDISSIFTSFFMGYASSKLINLTLDVWEDGWSYYINPEKMFIECKHEDFSKLNKKDLEDKLKIALDNESYEEADKIKKELEKYKN